MTYCQYYFYGYNLIKLIEKRMRIEVAPCGGRFVFNPLTHVDLCASPVVNIITEWANIDETTSGLLEQLISKMLVHHF